MIHVVAVITAKPGMRAAILQAFQANVPAVKAEQGCIEYGAAELKRSPSASLNSAGAWQTFRPGTPRPSAVHDRASGFRIHASSRLR